MIYTVTLNPALDKTVEISNLTLNTVNRITSLRTDPGGKGINVSKVIQQLGGRSITLALLAGQCGHMVADACKALGLDCAFTFTSGETRTNLKIVDPLLHTNTDINEPGPTVRPAVLDEMLEDLTARLTSEDVVVLAGSLPKGASALLYRQWTLACRDRGAKVFLDADGTGLAGALEASPYLLKPNREELARLVGYDLSTLTDVAEAGRRLLKNGTSQVVVSLGGEGALFLQPGGALRAYGLPVKVGSTVGAGDAMVAALAYSETAGLSLEESLRLAVAASAANVMCSGTQAAAYDDIMALIPQVIFEPI